MLKNSSNLESDNKFEDVDIVSMILREDFHAVNFDVEGVHYTFSGWWLLDIGSGEDDYRVYDSKEEFLKDHIFSGRTLPEVKAENIFLELDP